MSPGLLTATSLLTPARTLSPTRATHHLSGLPLLALGREELRRVRAAGPRRGHGPPSQPWTLTFGQCTEQGSGCGHRASLKPGRSTESTYPPLLLPQPLEAPPNLGGHGHLTQGCRQTANCSVQAWTIILSREGLGWFRARH